MLKIIWLFYFVSPCFYLRCLLNLWEYFSFHPSHFSRTCPCSCLARLMLLSPFYTRERERATPFDSVICTTYEVREDNREWELLRGSKYCSWGRESKRAWSSSLIRLKAILSMVQGFKGHGLTKQSKKSSVLHPSAQLNMENRKGNKEKTEENDLWAVH